MKDRQTKKTSEELRYTGSDPRSGNYRKDYLIRMLWLYPLLCGLLYLLSGLFIEPVMPRLIISGLLGFFPWKEAVNKIYAGNRKHLRSQLLVLLQVLCTSVSSGYSIETALLLIRPVIEHTFGQKSLLNRPLITLENDLKMHMSLEEALMRFSDSIDFPEISPVFHSLAISGRIGNNSLAILRSSCQMLSELNAVQNEINAQNAGKNAEAAILCLMPFLITAALDSSGHGYLQMARASSTGSVILAIAFGICILAAALLFRYMSHSEASGIKNYRPSKNDNDLSCKDLPLTGFAKKHLPSGFLSTRHELFSELSMNPDSAYELYLRKQLLTVPLSFVAALTVLLITGNSLWPAFILPFIIAFLNLHDARHMTQLKKEELMQDIPLFFCLIYTLLEAGIQLPKAIDICSKAFRKNPSLSGEINGLRAMMISGISASDAIEKMSLRIQIPEAQSALLLMARYGRLGTPEVLNLLSLQAASCWNLCRNAARKKQEREALSLLVPMTLDFICVLLVATAPAIISLGL